jgi:hypothetical protein
MNLFETTIQRGAQGRWPVVVEQSTAGTFLPVRTEGALQLDLAEFKTQLISQVTPLDYGTLLGQALFRDGIRDAFVQALAKSDGQMHVLINVQAEDLQTIRWERLAGPFGDDWEVLARTQWTPFSINVSAPNARRFTPLHPWDLRALVVVASPAGINDYHLLPFDAAAAVAAARDALGRIPCDVLVSSSQETSDLPTLDVICERLTRGRYTILHVVCHGRLIPAISSSRPEAVLYLSRSDGTVGPVEGSQLLNRLRSLQPNCIPVFAFFAACESAREPEHAAFSSLSRLLLSDSKLDMHAVLGMTEQISISTAKALTGAFYRWLREHGHIDRALVEACAGLGERPDVYVPVLHSRLRAQCLFADPGNSVRQPGLEDLKISDCMLPRPVGTPTFFGRLEELDALNRAWESSSTHVVVVNAAGGVGKTRLVREWRSRKAYLGWYDFERVFDWSFYSQGTREYGVPSSDDFFTEALTFFGDPGMARSRAIPVDKAARLAELVAQRRSLLVLDGLEPMQAPPHWPDSERGRLQDRALAALLKKLADRNCGLCIVTTREGIPDLDDWIDKTVMYLGKRASEQSRYPTLENLTGNDGVALLQTIGVRGGLNDLRQAVKEYRGHALALQLLGRYLVLAKHWDIRRRDRVNLQMADDDTMNGHAFRVIMAYERWFSPRPFYLRRFIGWLLPKTREMRRSETRRRCQLAILRLLGLFDRPADFERLKVLATGPALPEVTEPLIGLAEDDLNLSLSALEETGLITVLWVQDALPTRRAGAVDTHPLIREYFAHQLRAHFPNAWKMGNSRLADYLRSRVTQQLPETIEELELLFQAAAHICLAGNYRSALRDLYRARIVRGDLGHATRKFGLFSSELAFLRRFFHQGSEKFIPELRDEEDQTLVYRSVGFNLAASGRMDEGLRLLGLALELADRRGDSYQAAITARNMANFAMNSGDIDRAISVLTANLHHADATSDLFMPVGFRCSLGYARYFQEGPGECVLALFQEAWQRNKTRLDQSPLELPMFQYYEVLLGAERAQEVIQLIDERHRPGAPELTVTGEALDQLALAMAQVALGRLTDAEQTMSANEGLVRQSGRPEFLARWHMIRVDLLLRSHGRQIANERVMLAIATSLNEADEISERGRFDLLRIEYLRLRAWHDRVSGKPETQVTTSLDQAQEVANRGRMRLRLADIALDRARLLYDRNALDLAQALVEQLSYRGRSADLVEASYIVGVRSS